MSEPRFTPNQPYIQDEASYLERMIVELECYAKKMRKALVEQGKDTTFTKTLLLFWYAPTKQQFQCHILGRLVSGRNLTDVCIAAQEEFVRIYNECFETEVQVIWDCTFDFKPETWTKQKLVNEYKRLTDLLKKESQQKHTEVKKRGVGRPKKNSSIESEDAIRLCADKQKKEKKQKHHKEKLSRYEQVEEYLGKKANESERFVRQDLRDVEYTDSEVSN